MQTTTCIFPDTDQESLPAAERSFMDLHSLPNSHQNNVIFCYYLTATLQYKADNRYNLEHTANILRSNKTCLTHDNYCSILIIQNRIITQSKLNNSHQDEHRHHYRSLLCLCHLQSLLQTSPFLSALMHHWRPDFCHHDAILWQCVYAQDGWHVLYQ